MDEKIIKTAIKNMNTWLDECRADSDAVVMTAKAIRSIRDNYCELLRYRAEIERLKEEIRIGDNTFALLDRPLVEVKAEAIKEISEKITEVFMRYAHLHSYAEGAKKDYIEATDGTEIEMQSVWDVFTLQKNGMAEYEEMNRLQSNIETIEKERLLTELEKDFRLLVKEMVGEYDAKHTK